MPLLMRSMTTSKVIVPLKVIKCILCVYSLFFSQFLDAILNIICRRCYIVTIHSSLTYKMVHYRHKLKQSTSNHDST
jgi:hypothetical protein